VTDLLMPVMDGFALLESLQSVGHTVPVIVVSADIQQSSRDRCKELGCQTFLNKPFKSPALIEAVECALAHMQTKVLS
jgi:twitching motility two-component system response regulator PilH